MKKAMFVLIVWFLVGAVGHAQYAPQDEYMARSYDDARLVRVKYASGEAYVKRNYEDGFEEAVTNLPVFDRDLVGTTDGRMELYLGRLNYLRLDYDSEVEFSRAPLLGRTGTQVRVTRGGLYLLVHSLDRRGDIEIQTPDCGVYVHRNGRYRINVSPEYGSEIIVYKGNVDVNGNRNGMDLQTGQRITFFDGRIINQAHSYSDYRDRGSRYDDRESGDEYGYFGGYRDIEDDFARWNFERDRMVSRYSNYRSRYLGSGYGGYEYELSQAGRWVYDQNYGTHIWIPRRVSSGWRPYSNGRWIFHPTYGYVWTSYDPWGWHTHYYGRWHWSPGYGWAWVPGRKWGPAWVSWCRTDHYYGWAPLSHWNRPIIIINNRWDRGYRYRGGIPITAASVVVVQSGHLWSANIRNVGIAPTRRAGIKAARFQFMGKRPQYRPKYQHISVVNAKGRTVRYKSSGFLSSKHYTTVSKGPRGTVVKRGTVYRYTPAKGKTTHTTRINRYSTQAPRGRQRTVNYGRKQRTVYKIQPRQIPKTSRKNTTTKRSVHTQVTTKTHKTQPDKKPPHTTTRTVKRTTKTQVTPQNAKRTHKTQPDKKPPHTTTRTVKKTTKTQVTPQNAKRTHKTRTVTKTTTQKGTKTTKKTTTKKKTSSDKKKKKKKKKEEK
jgi:hypothetical protein